MISSILFAVSANIDNFTVGIAYGIKKIKINFLSNLLIALITAAGTFISMAIGLGLSKFLSVTAANIIGSVILILLGVWIAKDFFKKERKLKIAEQKEQNIAYYSQILQDPELADKNNSGTIDIKESLTLAFALTINNFGLGIGASITGLNIFATVLCTFFVSILSIALGCLLGQSCLSRLLGKFAPLISGVIVILLGIYELLI